MGKPTVNMKQPKVETTVSSSVCCYSELSQQRVLLVDDEPGIVDILAELITGMGLAVDSCADGKEAVQKLKTQSYDLLLTDVIMPQMNGIELIAFVRESQLDMPILVMSGYMENEQLSNLEPGLKKKLLKKPFRAKDLMKAIAKELDY